MDRKTVNLLLLLAFGVMVVSGVMAFILPFSIKTTGLHALMGFVFLALIVVHVFHNGSKLQSKRGWTVLILPLLIIALLTALFIWQPTPVKAVLSTSNNLGAALDRFEMDEGGVVYRYSPADNYKLKLDVRYGQSYDPSDPPEIAIWLENKSAYHIKTLHTTEDVDQLPYWAWKVREYEKAKKEAGSTESLEVEKPDDVDGVIGATPNSSFDPRDYILPERNTEPFFLVIEINQAGDKNEHYEDQPSILYRVEIDNQYPKFFQVLDILGYSRYDADEKNWAAYYPDGTLTSSLRLIDSAMLVLDRGED